MQSLNFDRVKADMLADNIHGYIKYVNKSYQEKNSYLSHPEKLYRLKHLTDEFNLPLLASELTRINRFVYDEKYTRELVHEIRKAISIIGDYIEQNEEDLFIFVPRIHILRSLCRSFTSI